MTTSWSNGSVVSASRDWRGQGQRQPADGWRRAAQALGLLMPERLLVRPDLVAMGRSRRLLGALGTGGVDLGRRFAKLAHDAQQPRLGVPADEGIGEECH